MTRIQISDLHPDLPTATKWLMMLRHFLASPYGETAIGIDVLRAMYYEYKTAKKQDDGLAKIRALARDDGPGQLETDLVTLRTLPPGDLRRPDGQINLSAVARALGRQAGGSGWEYVREVGAALGDEWGEAA